MEIKVRSSPSVGQNDLFALAKLLLHSNQTLFANSFFFYENKVNAVYMSSFEFT